MPPATEGVQWSAMNYELLKRLCETPGISSSEGAIRKLVAEELRPIVDDLDADVMGNLVAVRNGIPEGPRVMIAAHLDEIGFRVRFVDDKGKLTHLG